MEREMCPSHPSHPIDECGPCEVIISASEDRNAAAEADDAWYEAQESRYERHLDAGW